jgi:hypothetical protein
MRNVLAYAHNAEDQVARIGCGVVEFRSKVTSAAEDARRTARRAWRSAGDAVDEVAVTIKKQPLKSIGVAFGVAFGFGAFTGWLLTRKWK